MVQTPQCPGRRRLSRERGQQPRLQRRGSLPGGAYSWHQQWQQTACPVHQLSYSCAYVLWCACVCRSLPDPTLPYSSFPVSDPSTRCPEKTKTIRLQPLCYTFGICSCSALKEKGSSLPLYSDTETSQGLPDSLCSARRRPEYSPLPLPIRFSTFSIFYMHTTCVMLRESRKIRLSLFN